VIMFVSDQEDTDVSMSSFAYSCITYVCGFKRVGSMIAIDGGGSQHHADGAV
jgi:hypothetical protein